MWSAQYPSAQTQISNSVGSPSSTGLLPVAVNVLIPGPAQTREKPSARSTLPAQPVPSPWTKPSHSAAICASVVPGRITPTTWSIAAAAISFASRMRSISCAVLTARAATRSGVASTAPGNASNHAFV